MKFVEQSHMKIKLLESLKLKIAELPEPLRIGIALGMGFAGTLLVVILVMIVGFSYMAKTHFELEKITQVNSAKIELAHTMKYIQRERAVNLYTLALLTDPFEKDEELQRFNKKAVDFLSAWEKFQSMGMNAQEELISANLKILVKERGRTVKAAVDYAMSHFGLHVADYIRKEAIPGQQEVADEVDKLLLLQQEQMNQAVLGAAESYRKARTLMILLCSIAILIGILVAVVVLRQVMRQSRELEHKALFDDLTGLPNRVLFFDRLSQAAAKYGNENKPFSIAILDLDRFKEVNDARGHHVGDLLLKYVAQRVSAAMRRTDTVARMGGDEFALLLPGVAANDAEFIVKKLLASISQRVTIEGNVVNCALSLGIASYPEHDDDIKRLLLKADVAMYAAKRANVGYRVYTPEIEIVEARNIELQEKLRFAIENDQLQLHYQPKISHRLGCITGVEALVRWNHPERGMIPPDEFIPQAESSGLIQPLALWVLQEALRQSTKWHEKGYEFTVSVNLSTRNLLDGDLPARVAKLLELHHGRPEWLVFEITESAVMVEPARALETLTKLNKMGIQLSLDDFGTGYSSLAYLKKLPVSEIKIDKSFIKDMELDANDTVIVRSTIALGHNLGMKVVAEGVENEEIWDLLSALGCDASQGYYMSRPMTASAMDGWMKASVWAKEKENIQASIPFVERRMKETKPL